MRIAIIADQHGTLPEIPMCDLLIVSGDITGGPDYLNGKWRPDLSDAREFGWLKTKFAQWAKDAPHTIVVAGNHDTCVEKMGFPKMESVTYLEDSGCNINGINFWGTPWITRFDNLAFNRDETEHAVNWENIPINIDVLICHMPPKSDMRLDEVNGKHVGSICLRNVIQRVSPKLLTCGHIHEGVGAYEIDGTKIVNAAQRFTVVNINPLSKLVCYEQAQS